MALRSKRLIIAVLISLFAGLLMTAALGLAMVGALNMISVAFAVLFVGLGVDFGIQFGVRYRAERHVDDSVDVGTALERAARVGHAAGAGRRRHRRRLLLLPAHRLPRRGGTGQDRRRRHDRGLPRHLHTAAGADLADAARGRPRRTGVRWLAPADAFFERHRKPVLLATSAAILLASPLLLHLRFDFDPLHLKDPHSESMATLLALKDAPQAGTDDVSVLAPSLDAARQVAGKLVGAARGGARSRCRPSSRPTRGPSSKPSRPPR